MVNHLITTNIKNEADIHANLYYVLQSFVHIEQIYWADV